MSDKYSRCRTTAARTSRTQLIDADGNLSARRSDDATTDASTTTNSSAAGADEFGERRSAAAVQPPSIMAKKSFRTREKEKKIKRGPIKERWLLTRKTWKYMADAGRKLIPDGVANRPEDLPRIEEYFQKVCQSEPKFLPWRRKTSYPGALTSLRRKRHSKYYRFGASGGGDGGGGGTASDEAQSPPKASSADEAEDERDDNQRLLVMIRMLEKYLNIKDTGDESTAKYLPEEQQSMIQYQSSLARLNATIAEDQNVDQAKDEQQKPVRSSGEQLKQNWLAQPYESVSAKQQDPSSSSGGGGKASRSAVWASSMHTSLLLDSLRNYSQTSKNPLLSHDRISSDVLNDKRLLRQIRDELKQQQLDRILHRHTSRSTLNLTTLPSSHIPTFASSSFAGSTASIDRKNKKFATKSPPSATSSATSIFNFWQREPRPPETSQSIQLRHYEAEQIGSDDQQDGASSTAGTSVRKSATYVRQFQSTTVQTDPMPITTIHQLYNSYLKKKKQDEEEGGGQGGDSKHSSRRKSSIDNEDVSQSVSDTIKRYLRMARKKSVTETDANRFKRINYDKNLRNIKAKGEITMPGDDDGLMKGCQTDADWIWLVMQQIKAMGRDSFSPDSTDDDQLSLSPVEVATTTGPKYAQHTRKVQKTRFDYSQIPVAKTTTSSPPSVKSTSTSPSHSSPPSPSPSGLFHSSTQFLSNLLWHGHGDKQQQPQLLRQTKSLIASTGTTATTSTTTTTTTTATTPTNFNIRTNDDINPNSLLNPSSVASHLQPKRTTGDDPTAMQKSKSSSNVGQALSKKIFKSRSKSQSRILLNNSAAPPVRSADGTTNNQTGKPHWMPQGNCVWTSSGGRRIELGPTRLQDLSDIERKTLQRVAVDRINQLNIGVVVVPPNDNSAEAIAQPATPKKRRAPLLLKRKALTTGFFDTTKTGDDRKGSGAGLVFGLTLEKCVDNDSKFNKSAPPITTSQLQDNSPKSRSKNSRNSISSLLDSRRINSGSCESLPATKELHFTGGVGGGGGEGRAAGARGSLELDYSDIAASALSTATSGLTLGQARNQVDEQLRLSPDIHWNSTLQIPAMVQACINHLVQHGLHVVGIFRVSTSKRRIRQLREEFDNGTINSIDSEVGAHDVASLLKEYLRDLPEPLLCRCLYKPFLQTQKIRNRRLQLEALSHMIQLLPVAHRDTLYALLKFLALVARCSDDITETSSGQIVSVGNKMDSTNLATVIAPNILHNVRIGDRPELALDTEVEERIDVINVIRTMIDHVEDLFRIPAEVMDDVYTTMMDAMPQQLDFLCGLRSMQQDDGLESSAESSSQPTSPPPAPPTKSVDEAADLPMRKMYVRQEFTHENSAKIDQSNGAVKRRERTSKMKYQEPENEISRRRRRQLTSNTSTTGTQLSLLPQPQSQTIHSNLSIVKPRSSSIDSNNGVYMTATAAPQQTYQPQQQQQPSRRLSTPMVQHDAGILSASLQLPVHVQQPLNLAADLPDIPYIEDDRNYGIEFQSTSGENYSSNRKTVSNLVQQQQIVPPQRHQRRISSEHQSKITGQLQLSSAQPYQQQQTYDDPPSPPHYIQMSSSASSATQFDKSLSHQKTVEKSHSLFSVGPSKIKSRKVLHLPQSAQSTGPAISAKSNNEPQLTPSISNIGGALLRSKTADFERLLQAKKSKSNGDGSTATTTTTATPKTTSSSAVSTTVTSTTQPATLSTKRSGSGLIYKRQELISSVQQNKQK